MEHEKSYVYEPAKTNGTKKRKRQEVDDEAWQCRKRVFERLWTRQNARIETVLTAANETTLDQVTDFINKARDPDTLKVPAGIINAGPNLSSHDALFRQLGQRLKAQGSIAYVRLSASDSPNLKSLLKTLIAKAAAIIEGLGNGVAITKLGKGPKPLNYDLRLLQDYIESAPESAVVVVFEDTEAFDSHVMSEAIDLLHLWHTRIPFTLLFGVGTSTEAFQDRLSRSALRKLQGDEFDVVQADELLERVFSTAIDGNEERLWLGPDVTSMLFDRQKDHLQNAVELVDALKYAYMSHFFANQVSVWTDPLGSEPEATDADLEAVRMLPSFQHEIEQLLGSGQNSKAGAPSVKELLSSADHLRSWIPQKVQEGHIAMRKLTKAVYTVHNILSGTMKDNSPPLSALFARAVGGRLARSPLLREMVLRLKRADSEALKAALDRLEALDTNDLAFVASTATELGELIKTLSANEPLRSEHDDSHTTVRTTIIAKKAQLSKEKSTLSKKDTAYSELLTGFVSSLERYLDESLINPRELCLHEVFMYDVKGPHKSTFSPKTRAAVERALSAPHDYLACECCGKESEGNLSANLPPTALLYQLYLESGSLINVSDLYSAYAAIIGDQFEDEERVEALFQRGLAELKYLGIVKPTRKKTDHIAKVTWAGL